MITNHNFLAVYFDRRHKDLKLLLNLLAETSGLPESFRILTLFDKKFQVGTIGKYFDAEK